MVARLYALNGTYVGRVVWVDEFLNHNMVSICIKDIGGDSLMIVPMSMIEISVD